MNEIIKNTATAITFIIALSLPILTIMDAWSTTPGNRKILNAQHQSVLELPLITEGYDPVDLKKIENINFELNGLLTVYAMP